jgi:hypothetical protein
MNTSFESYLNPLQDHLQKQENIKRQNSIIGYGLAFCLGLIVCYILMKSYMSHRTKEEGT